MSFAPTSTIRTACARRSAAFCVTNYWEYLSPEREIDQARNLAQAAADTGLKHVIWSTLEDTRKWVPLSSDQMPTLMGSYKVPHFDAKGEADREFSDLGVPTTFMLASFYWENYIYFGSGPQRGSDGVLTLAVPMGDAKLAGIATEDIGKSAYGIFRRGDEYIGKRVGIASDQLRMDEIAAAMTSAFGEEVRYAAVPPEVFRSFGFPGAEEVGNMFQFYRDFGQDVLATRSVEETRKLNPELQSFRDWLAENARRIPVPEPAK
jgi:uncharacterized protein YbjT (DUF2867 family)